MRLISTIQPPPIGFEYIPSGLLKPVDLLTGGAAAVLTHEAEDFLDLLDKRLASISGMFIQIGTEYSMSQIHETLWLIQVPVVMYDGLLVFVMPILHTLSVSDEQWEIRRLIEYQFERLKRDTAETNHDFEIMTQRLRHKLDEQTKTNALLDLKSEELQGANTKLLKAKQEAEQANQSKSLFLATMSHEIRTPLNAVIGLADIFDRSNLSTDQVKSLETIRYSAGVLMGVLTDILDFSKIESGKLERVDKPFSLREALKQIVSIFENDATQKGVLLTCKTDPNLPNMLTGDEVRVRQIILNLCSNAIKFSGSDKNEGRVSICARLVDNVEEKNWFEVLVEDNGIGIDQAGMEKLFKPFSQVDASTSRKYGGTGLGLSISQQLSELLGGSISCKSEVGNGSCFTLRLPFQSATGEKKEAAGEVSPMPDWVRGLKVLIAEDNPINQMVIRKQITKLGMNAHVVDNGLQALEYYRNNKVDLLLTDCHMPELDGYGLSEQIRALEKSEQLPRLPIIAITADAVVGAETYEAANLDAYLVKPVSLVALRRAIMARANFLIKANKAS